MSDLIRAMCGASAISGTVGHEPDHPQSKLPVTKTPCQICSGHLDRPSYIGRICDIFKPLTLPLRPGGEVNHLPNPSANWAELVPNRSTLDEFTGAALIAQNGMLYYRKRGSSEDEVFKRIRWAKRTAKAYRGFIGDLQPSTDCLPCPVLFPLCGNCTRLVRNYVSHWNINHPHSQYYGYDVLYEGLVRRLLSLSSDPMYLKAFYAHDEPVKSVELLGVAVLVQAVPAREPFERYPIPSWTRVYPFNQIPSLPRWLLSKLKPLESSSEGEDEIPVDDCDLERSQASPENTSNTLLAPVISKAVLQNRYNGLCSLPVELLQMIAVHLDRHSLFSLRKSARQLAAALPLDQFFWFRELLYSEVPLFGFEPLNADAHVHLQIGGRGVFGRIDAFSEIEAQFKPRRTIKFDPVKSRYLAAWPSRRDWRRYDWRAFVWSLAKVKEFEDGGACADAPDGFRARRWLWGELDKIYKLIPAQP